MIQTVGELLEYRAQVHGKRNALLFENESFTYEQIDTISNQYANYLLGIGLGHGDRIGILDFNKAKLIHLFHACAKIGIIPIMPNWRLSSPQIEYILTDAKVKLFFYGSQFSNLAINTKLFDSCMIDNLKIDSEAKVIPNNIKIKTNDILTQLYTSGTTGHPKGALLSHANLLGMVTGLSQETPGFGADSINLVTGPFFNIAGVGIHLLGFYTGATNVIIERFDPELVARQIHKTGVTNVFLAPAMIQAILALPELVKYDFNSLRNIQYGGSTIALPILKKAYDIFKCGFTQAYGLTETSGISTLLRFDDHIRFLDSSASKKDQNRLLSSGKVAPGIEIIIKDNDHQSLSFGEAGEVCIRGDYLFSGYWNHSQDQVFDKDGWFHSGDIGYLDDENYLFIIDRKNDMIISKGINIYPAIVERVYHEHPLIDEIAIIGIPDVEYGEAVYAAIVTKSESDPGLELNELRNWGRAKLGSHELPRYIGFVKELPRNPSGKILRRELRAPFWENLSRKI